MDKQSQLDALRQEIIADKNLPLMEANLVFGEGDPDCQIMFIGEAPGKTEDELGRPFVGRAGKLLDQLIGEVGWKREQVYISNIVKRRPPENRDPLPAEIEAYKPYLAKQIEIINPKVIAPLGRFSMNYFLPEAKISLAHGKVFSTVGRIIFPLYHPAAALRATSMLEALRNDFKNLPLVVKGESLPATPSGITKSTPVIPKRNPPPQIKLF